MTNLPQRGGLISFRTASEVYPVASVGLCSLQSLVENKWLQLFKLDPVKIGMRGVQQKVGLSFNHRAGNSQHCGCSRTNAVIPDCALVR